MSDTPHETPRPRVACCTNAACAGQFKMQGRLPSDASKLRCPKCNAPLELRPVASASAPEPAPLAPRLSNHTLAMQQRKTQGTAAGKASPRAGLTTEASHPSFADWLEEELACPNAPSAATAQSREASQSAPPDRDRCPVCDSALPEDPLLMCPCCGFDRQKGRQVGSPGQSFTPERRHRARALVRGAPEWAAVRGGLRLMYLGAAAQSLGMLLLALTTSPPFVHMLVPYPFVVVFLIALCGIVALRWAAHEDMPAVTLALGYLSLLYTCGLLIALAYAPLKAVVVVVAAFVLAFLLSGIAGLLMIGGTALCVFVPVSWRLRLTAVGAIAAVVFSAACFVSAVSTARQGAGPPASTAGGTQAIAGASVPNGDRADNAQEATARRFVTSVAGWLFAPLLAHSLMVLFLRGVATFMGDESTRTTATTYLVLYLIVNVAALAAAVLTLGEPIATDLAVLLAVFVMFSGAIASAVLFRLVRDVHDLVS